MDIKKKIEQAAKGFKTLTVEDCFEITLASKSLSVQECYEALLIDPETLEAEETKFVDQLHKYGRAIGVKDATEHLFYHMKAKGGDSASLEYLRQMSGEFSVLVTPTGGTGFHFNVNIDGKK